jgi:type I restriction enzyme S subunit
MREFEPAWRQFKLGDLVENINEYHDRTVLDPERFVAGEHIDEGSLPVRRWGLTTDDMFPPTFNRRFRAGDVLFHSRNLRKLARPDFDGITGEKLFVLRVKRSDVLLSDLLPFVLRTSHFTEYVNRMWAGSTNKFLNKTPLMFYKFALPPLDEQRRIARGLQAADSAAEAVRQALEASQTTYNAALAHTYMRNRPSPGVSPEHWGAFGWPCVALESITADESPISYGIVQPGHSVEGGIPTVTSNNLNIGFEDRIHLTDPKIEAAYARTRIRGGDILVTVKGFGTGNIGVVPSFFSGNITRDVARIRLRNATDVDFLIHLWKSPAFERYWRAVSVGTTRPELSIGRLRAMNVPWPESSLRAEVSTRLSRLVCQSEQLEARLTQSIALTSTFVEHALSTGAIGGAS